MGFNIQSIREGEPVMSVPTVCPYCECELEIQEAEPDVGLFFSGVFCSECNFEISSDDFGLYDDDL